MLGISSGEVFLILLIAFLLFGPQKLPGIMRNWVVGRPLSGRMTMEFQQEMDRAVGPVKSEFTELGKIDVPEPPTEKPPEAPAAK